MQKDHSYKGIRSFYSAIKDLQDKIINTQLEIMGDVASLMANAIKNDKRIFIFGTGHSHMMMEETFYRAGGVPAAVPIFITSLMLHESAGLSSKMERIAGLAKPILDEYSPEKGDLLFVYSNSGVNQLPIELAMDAKSRGMIVIAVCAKEYAKIAPLSSLKKRLFEIADYTIDNFGIPGDAIVEIEDCPWRVGSSSTITGSLIWNSLLSEAITLLREQTSDIPVFASFNMEGAPEHNQGLLSKWSKINPHLPQK